MGVLEAIADRLGYMTKAHAERIADECATKAASVAVERMNPIMSSLIAERGSIAVEPLDQSPESYLSFDGSFPWVSACINAIGNSVSSRRLVLKRRRPDGSSIVIDSHEILDLIRNPNPDDGEFSFRRRICDQLLRAGEAILTAVPSTSATASAWKKPREVWVQRADRMKPVLSESLVRAGTGESVIVAWRYEGPGGWLTIPPEHVLQIVRPHPRDPLRALSPMKELQSTLLAELSARRWTASFFAGGGIIPTVIAVDPPLQKADFEMLKQELLMRRKSLEALQIPLMMNGKSLSVTQTGIDPKRALLPDILRMAQEETLAVYGCTPFVVGLLNQPAEATAREQMRQFLVGAVMPLCRLIESAMNSHPMVQSYGDDLYLEHEFTDEALQANEVDQMTADTGYVKSRVKTPNEVRTNRQFGDALDGGDEFPEPAGPALMLDPGDDAERSATRDDGIMAWRAVSAIRTPGERSIKAAVMALQDDLRDESVATIQSWGGIVPPNAALIDLFDARAAESVWTDRLVPIAVRIAKSGKARPVSRRGRIATTKRAKLSADLSAYATTRIRAKVKTILRSRLDELATIARKAVENGETSESLAKTIRTTFADRGEHWAETISRTETAALYNAGAIEGMRDAGIETKEWLSSRDGDVRDSHEEIDGESVGIDEDFVLAGGRGPWPGEIDSPAESCNCRCAVVMGAR